MAAEANPPERVRGGSGPHDKVAGQVGSWASLSVSRIATSGGRGEGMIRIKQGLDIPLVGAPEQKIDQRPRASRVALVGSDYIGMKPTMEVREGDHVRRGQLLFTDKKVPGIRFTSPAAGKVLEINRGDKRVFQSLVIQVEGDEQETFNSYYDSDLPGLSREQVRDNLVQSGLWTSLRTRPFSKVPDPNSVPHALFVTAMDTTPLAAQPEVILGENSAEFRHGLQVLKHLTDGRLFLCKAPGVEIPGADLEIATVEEFAGPHPAGLPGTHIHFLSPVSEKRTVWYVGYQDVVAIGQLFVTGKLPVERVVSLAGSSVERPRLVRTQLGASLDELTEGELKEGNHRVISGSVLSGRTATGPFAYLGRYHQQVSVIPEGGEREFLGWQKPGFDKFSIKRVFASAFLGKGQKFELTTSRQGSKRAMVPVGAYERVLPLDMIPTFLLRALITGDTEQAQLLGCLELDEEDLALCTFVCPGKYEYGPMLRRSLTEIEKEG
jgi:Na+-transporting NADH:ubiquinone oxidoreductase subunit A